MISLFCNYEGFSKQSKQSERCASTIPILQVVNQSKGKWMTICTNAGCLNWGTSYLGSPFSASMWYVRSMIREQLPLQLVSVQKCCTQGSLFRSSETVEQIWFKRTSNYEKVKQRWRWNPIPLARCPNMRLSFFCLPFSSHHSVLTVPVNLSNNTGAFFSKQTKPARIRPEQ